METVQQPLIEQGILGIIALLSVLGIIQVYKTVQAEKKALLEMIDAKDKIYTNAVGEFTKASIMNAEALTKLTTFLQAHRALNNSHGTIQS